MYTYDLFLGYVSPLYSQFLIYLYTNLSYGRLPIFILLYLSRYFPSLCPYSHILKQDHALNKEKSNDKLHA